MKYGRQEKTISKKTDFFERFGIGEHIQHPSFAMDDCDFEGIVN